MEPLKLLLIFSLSLFLSSCAEDKQSVVLSNSATVQSQPQKTETTFVSCDQFSNFDPFSIPEIKSAIEPLLMYQIEKDFKASGGFITNPRRNLVPSLSLIFYNIKWKLVSCPVDKIPKNVNWRFFEKTELAAHTGKEILIFGPTFSLMNSLDKAKAIVREAMFSFYLMKYFNLDQICGLKVDEYLGPNTSLVELCSNDFLDKNRDQFISEKYEKINSQDLENINKSAGWIISKLIAGNQQVDDVFYDTYINQLIKWSDPRFFGHG